MKSYCKWCHSWKPVTEFYEREDRDGYYKWCKDCMDKNGRSVKWPPATERGYGKTK